VREAVALAGMSVNKVPEWVRSAQPDGLEALLEALFNRLAQCALFRFEALLASNLNRNFCRVYIGSKEDVHEEFLKDTQELFRHVDLHRTCLTRLNLAQPAALGLQDLVFQGLKHHNKLVLIEGVGSTLSLLLPLLVSL